jgi:hypothetical protein
LFRKIRNIGFSLFSLQFLALASLSTVLYNRMDLGIDYAIFSQAWTEIGKGNLNPYSSLFARPFIDGHFELIMWPLGILYLFVHSPIVLLFVQDAAIAATGMAAFVWVLRLVEKRSLPRPHSIAICALILILLLISPVSVANSVEDFHFEAISAFFAVMAAFCLWQGKQRKMWVWVGLCLLCGDLGGLLVLGIGLSAMLAARESRKTGLVLTGLGVVWIVFIGLIGANLGDNTIGYAYLAGRTTLPHGLSGAVMVSKGVLAHPLRPAHMIFGRLRPIAGYLFSGGLLGFFTPWGFPISALVLVSAALQADPLFINGGFQNIAVVPFVTVGTAILLAALVATPKNAKRARSAAVALGCLALMAGLVNAVWKYPIIGTSRSAHTTPPVLSQAGGSAARTALSLTPDDAEVIASNPIMGRFGQRRYVYWFQSLTPHGTEKFPVKATTVVLVLDRLSTAPGAINPKRLATVIEQLQARDHATIIVNRGGIVAVLWHPIPGQRIITLP